MAKSVDQVQAALDREIEYTRKVNDKNALLTEQVKDLKRQLEDSISKAEHEKIIAELRTEYEGKLPKNKIQQKRKRNERGAGRKRIASKEIAEMVLALSEQGLSQARIAARLSDELNFRIGRTTVGEIVRGNYTPLEIKRVVFPIG